LRNVVAIAVNVIKDTARKKIFYVVFLFGLVVVAEDLFLETVKETSS